MAWRHGMLPCRLWSLQEETMCNLQTESRVALQTEALLAREIWSFRMSVRQKRLCKRPSSPAPPKKAHDCATHKVVWGNEGSGATVEASCIHTYMRVCVLDRTKSGNKAFLRSLRLGSLDRVCRKHRALENCQPSVMSWVERRAVERHVTLCHYDSLCMNANECHVFGTETLVRSSLLWMLLWRLESKRNLPACPPQ